MTETTDRPVSSVNPLGTKDAPFIYFDGITAFGMNHGVVQVELAANVITPDGHGGIRQEVAMTCHLRCSPNAAADLRQTLEKALLLVAKAEGQVN
jgi:hypothetical protein